MMKKVLVLFSVVLFLVACSKKDPNDTLGNTLLPKKVQEDLKSYETTVDTTNTKIFNKNKTKKKILSKEREGLISETEPNIYINDLYRFETLVPSEWEQKNDQMGTLVVFIEPKTEEDPFQSNINIIAQPLTQEFENLTLDDYIANSIKEIQPFFDTFEVLGDESSTFGGNDSKVVTYKVSKGEQTLKLVQRIVKHNGIVYVITYTSTEEEYDLFFDKFKTVENSFRFKE